MGRETPLQAQVLEEALGLLPVIRIHGAGTASV
jgi:hypothetical protein